MISQSKGYHPELGRALEHLISSGGKRIRPAVALLTGCMLGAGIDQLVTLGAAIELLHTATLVHDDLIDGALMRRGIATLNAQWSPAATVLTGDFIFAQAAKVASEIKSEMVTYLFAQTLVTIVNGEITQLFSSRGSVNRNDYYVRIHAKTASMFELATTAAAHLSPVDEHIVANMKSFGYDIGMAFQIVDDILDFAGEQVEVGKPVASDLRQGLITLPALYYFEKNGSDTKINSFLQEKMNTFEFDELINSIRESGAIDLAMEEACRYVDHGLEILALQPDCPERQALIDLSEYIVRRNY